MKRRATGSIFYCSSSVEKKRLKDGGDTIRFWMQLEFQELRWQLVLQAKSILLKEIKQKKRKQTIIGTLKLKLVQNLNLKIKENCYQIINRIINNLTKNDQQTNKMNSTLIQTVLNQRIIYSSLYYYIHFKQQTQNSYLLFRHIVSHS
ncbi:Hypothetical_protein [Hexamita inflata]|uniref:Hypothetical_protein n=1 Tax=Hexamita inflata TaxID=28002 RepID=A0ABP1HBR6_9EUKA